MADLEEIVENPREGGSEGSGSETEGGLARRNSSKRSRPRKHRNFRGPEGTVQGFPLGRDPEERRKENGSGGQDGGSRTDGWVQDLPPTHEDHRTRFYEHYWKESEEYDKEFIKKYDEDLNTTLIFAGLFSAVTSAFIIEVHSHLQPDPNDETAALLRVLIHKIDNTTFGNDVPALPQWTGPPHTVVQVQAILFASLATSLLSAFLAMLGKQWLNRYALTDVRGTAIERSQNRQRKLDGIVAWYFDHVMESLPLMLQIGLLLLGCALSRYLWEINITVASVLIGVTSVGVIFYLSAVVAGAVSESCPYQTPGARILRHVLPHILHLIYSAPSAVSLSVSSNFSSFVQVSALCDLPIWWWSNLEHPWYSVENIISSLGNTLFTALFMLPIALGIDAYQVGIAILRPPVAFGKALFHRLLGTLPQTHVMDLRCVLWMLQTSLDKEVHLSSLEHLEPLVSIPSDFDPALVEHCFNAFVGCVNTNDCEVVVIQGLEQLATASALCFFHTISHLSVMDPTSSVLRDANKRYAKAFPSDIHFHGHHFSHTMNAIHRVFVRSADHRRFTWDGYKPPNDEHILVAQALLKLARFGYQRTQQTKVPRLILRFALYSLSLYPPPPTPVVADCLSIIAIDLGCDVSNTAVASLDKSLQVEEVSNLITQKLNTLADAGDCRPLQSKRKAITALLPYAMWQERDGRPEMFDTFLRAARASRERQLTWNRIKQAAITLIFEASPRAIILTSPHIPWDRLTDRGDLVQRWATAISAVPYTEEVGQSVVDMLLQIASVDELVPSIPVDIWPWLNKRPPLPPICFGRDAGSHSRVVKAVRALKDTEVLTSYFLLVWSEWNELRDHRSFAKMRASIQDDLGGIGMDDYRTELIQRLDHVLGQLDLGLEYLKQHNPELGKYDLWKMKRRYRKLKELLVDVERRHRVTDASALPVPGAQTVSPKGPSV